MDMWYWSGDSPKSKRYGNSATFGQSHDNHNFSDRWVTKFSKVWGSIWAPLARRSSAIKCKTIQELFLLHCLSHEYITSVTYNVLTCTSMLYLVDSDFGWVSWITNFTVFVCSYILTSLQLVISFGSKSVTVYGKILLESKLDSH